ncbi:FMN-linked oxidoreductase [Trichoderma reesei RUT C-30]|uniref:FMN-linked oxidoreductase n=1 Tax=Hypocrea jecorina (strain ATCC 56765 / BCRC 32924 / NRRL 11460 / Rut C-30) TaxID=1344414 RepID=A0A024SE04_HYPJR|nr:FMN-linked oxidoreductase [Trichoderma reesei RUT C-30]
MAELHASLPITLRCGLTLPNRLVKASMSEGISAAGSLPDMKIRNIYQRWAKGGWGMVITGNVQVDDRYLGTANDLAVDSRASDDTIVASWSRWAKVCRQHGTPTLVQLNHPGRQCPIGAGTHGYLSKNVAPTSIGLHMGDGLIPKAVSAIAFGKPRELEIAEIRTITQQFARAARLAYRSGFAGVEIHAAHGYLIDEFLTERTNRRSDAYGGSTERRAKFLIDIISAVRSEVPSSFCVGVTINSVDSVFPEILVDRVRQLELVTSAGVDFIEISGGTFEDPLMFLGPPKPSSSANMEHSEAYFVDFAKVVASKFPDVPLLLTGGFRCRESIEKAVTNGACSMVGIARPAAVNPLLPKTVMFNHEVKDSDATLYSPKIEAPWLIRQMGITALSVHMDNAWYLGHLKNMSKTLL